MTNPQSGSLRVDWPATLFLLLTPIAALAGVIWFFSTQSFTWGMFGLFVFFYFATGLSITGGYHRYFAHKTYEASWPVKLFFVLFGAAAFQNSILKWVVDHRVHHRFVDTPKDPYNAKRGFWYSHIGWMLMREKDKDNNPSVWGRDLLKDPMVVWQDRYYGLIAVAMGFGLPTLVGWWLGSAWGGFIFGGLVRTVFVHHVTFFINSLCHMLGGQPYSDTHTARDNGMLALFTYGEGYHNFHHQFASDYRNGIRWYQFDPTKWLIRSLAQFALTTNLKITPMEEILQAKMTMDEKRLKSKLGSRIHGEQASLLETLRMKAEAAAEKCRQLREEYGQRVKVKKSPEALLQLRRELKLAQRHLRQQYQQWRVMTRSLAKAS